MSLHHQPLKRKKISQYDADRHPTWRVALRRQRHVQQICRTPRLVYELLNELDRCHDLGESLDRRLAKYAAVDLSLLGALGADRFPERPLYRIEGAP